MRVCIWKKRFCSSGTGRYLSMRVCFESFAAGADIQYQNIFNNILVIW